MASREGSTQAEFTCQHASSHDARKLAGVLTGLRLVRATDTQDIEHGRLSFEDGTAANCSDFHGRHGDADMEIAPDTREG